MSSFNDLFVKHLKFSEGLDAYIHCPAYNCKWYREEVWRGAVEQAFEQHLYNEHPNDWWDLPVEAPPKKKYNRLWYVDI